MIKLAYIDISNFINWFITQVVSIGTQVINILDNIRIYNSVSLLDLIITIVIISMFLELILTIPNNVMNKAEREVKKDRQRKERGRGTGV